MGGTESGNAIADILFGDVNPGGKLPVTFPRAVGQVPIYYNHMNTGGRPRQTIATPQNISMFPGRRNFLSATG